MFNKSNSVDNYENRRREQIKEVAQVVGVTALGVVVTPIAMFAGATKTFSNVISERIQSFGAYIDDISVATARAESYQQASMPLPNQLLSDVVEVTRIEYPLISEARRY